MSDVRKGNSRRSAGRRRLCPVGTDDMTTRRRFLQGAAAAGAWTMARPYANAWASPVRAAAALPDPATAPFDHVVVLMFENRSFDHLLGWLPGADGKQAGLQFADQTGT